MTKSNHPKTRITKLHKYKVWKVSNPLMGPPLYLFSYKAACGMAKIWHDWIHREKKKKKKKKD